MNSNVTEVSLRMSIESLRFIPTIRFNSTSISSKTTSPS